MPDMLFPQVAPTPTPAKPAPSAPRTADPKPESQRDQGFSNVLQAQLEPEKETGQVTAEAQDTRADAAADAPTADAADGNPLPQSGNAPTPVLAVLDPLLQGTLAPVQSATDPLAAAGQTAVTLPGVPIEIVAESPAQARSGTARQQPAAAAAWQLRGGPWKTDATAVPDAAQSAVAQVVRSAVAELDENRQPGLSTFATEVRTAAVHSRMPVLDAMLDRLAATAAQPTAAAGSSSATQALQSPVLQDSVAPRPALPTTTVETPLRQPGWDQALSERVMWVANQKFQGAEIKLNPAHLGPIEVRVQLHQDQAQISFTAQHGTAREALEAALPRLRDMFSANGYNLVDVNVSQHSFAEQQRHAQGFGGRFHGAGQQEEDVESVVVPLPRSGAVTGLPSSAVDLFA